MAEHADLVQDGAVYEAHGEAVSPSPMSDSKPGVGEYISHLSAPMNELAFARYVFSCCDPETSGWVPATTLKDYLRSLDGHTASNEANNAEVVFLRRLQELLDPEGTNPLVSLDKFQSALLECVHGLPRELPMEEVSLYETDGTSAITVCDTSSSIQLPSVAHNQDSHRQSPRNVGELYARWRTFQAENEKLIQDCAELEERIDKLEAEKESLQKKLNEANSKEILRLELEGHIALLEEENVALRAETTRLQGSIRSSLQQKEEELDEMRAAFDHLAAEKNILEQETAAEIKTVTRNLSVRAAAVMWGYDLFMERTSERLDHMLTKLELAEEDVVELRQLFGGRPTGRGQLGDVSLAADLARAFPHSFLPSEILNSPEEPMRSGGRDIEYEYGDEGSVQRSVLFRPGQDERNAAPRDLVFQANNPPPTDDYAGRNWTNHGRTFTWLFLRFLMVIAATFAALPLLYIALAVLCGLTQLLLVLSAAVVLHVKFMFPRAEWLLEDIFDHCAIPVLGIRYNNHLPPV